MITIVTDTSVGYSRAEAESRNIRLVSLAYLISGIPFSEQPRGENGNFAAKMRGVADCVKNSDYTRLCVRKRGLTGGELFAKFVEKRIMPETAIGDLAVFILTPHDGRDKLERLYAATKNIM